jgi:hypothetical protein
VHVSTFGHPRAFAPHPTRIPLVSRTCCVFPTTYRLATYIELTGRGDINGVAIVFGACSLGREEEGTVTITAGPKMVDGGAPVVFTHAVATVYSICHWWCLRKLYNDCSSVLLEHLAAGWRRWTQVENEVKAAEAITRQGTTVHTRKRKRN